MEEIDYKELFQNMQIENEVLRHQMKHTPRFSFSLPNFGQLTEWLSDPMHLYGVFIGLCIIATIMQCVALVKEIRE